MVNLFGPNAQWDICLGRKAGPDEWEPYTSQGGYVRVDGKDIPCTAVHIDSAAEGLVMVTLTFIPRNLNLSVAEKED